MNRTIAVYAISLVAALGASYWSWTSRTETETPGGTTIARFDPDDIDAITWESDQKRLHLDVRNDDRGRYVWVEVREKAKRSGASDSEGSAGGTRRTNRDAGGRTEEAASSGRADATGVSGAESPGADAADAAPAAGGEPTTSPGADTEGETDSYLASSAVETLFEQLDPLRARRGLEAETRERRAMFGFDDPVGTLTVETGAGDRTRSFTVGDYTYGRRHLYLRDDRARAYYVADTEAVDLLRRSERRLRQRQLVDRRQPDLRRVVVRTGDQSAELVQHNPDDPSAAYWSTGSKDEKSRTAAAWIRKLLRLRIDRFVPDESESTLDRTATVVVHSRQGPPTRLRLLEGGSAESTRYFARSEFTRELVELPEGSASQFVDDIETLLAGGEISGAERAPGRRPGRSPARRGGSRPPGAGPPPEGASGD